MNVPQILDVGMHESISSKAYHADPVIQPSLNASIAKILCTKSPLHAWAAHPRLGGAKVANPDGEEEEEKDKGDSGAKHIGSLVHRLMLNAGPEITICPFDSWRKKDAQTMRADILAAGGLPTLPHHHERAEECAAAARVQLDDMGLGHVFRDGKKELTLVWKESETSPYQRAMLDELHLDTSICKAEVWDLKTVTRTAHPKACAAQITNMGYDLSRVFYKQGLSKLLSQDYWGRVAFKWAFVETSKPYAVTPVDISGEWETIALQHYSNALDAWSKHITSGKWPGYTTKVITLEPEPWMLAAAIGAEIAGNDS